MIHFPIPAQFLPNFPIFLGENWEVRTTLGNYHKGSSGSTAATPFKVLTALKFLGSSLSFGQDLGKLSCCFHCSFSFTSLFPKKKEESNRKTAPPTTGLGYAPLDFFWEIGK